jgi:hypothetical protein
MARKQKRSWTEPPEWWRKWRPLRWLAAGTIIFSLVSIFWTVQQYLPPPEHPETELYKTVEEQRVDLAGFRSYDTVDAVQAVLAAGHFTATSSQLYSTPSEFYPEHKMDTLTVEKYTHLDQPGRLTLEFFNDRLYEVDFAPAVPKIYAPALHKTLPELKRNQAGDTQWISGELRVASNVDLAANAVGQSLGSNAYVIWQDLRLIRQRDQWDRKFSAAPAEPRKGFWFW